LDYFLFVRDNGKYAQWQTVRKNEPLFFSPGFYWLTMPLNVAGVYKDN
jgi:hypothetical protein